MPERSTPHLVVKPLNIKSSLSYLSRVSLKELTAVGCKNVTSYCFEEARLGNGRGTLVFLRTEFYPQERQKSPLCSKDLNATALANKIIIPIVTENWRDGQGTVVGKEEAPGWNTPLNPRNWCWSVIPYALCLSDVEKTEVQMEEACTNVCGRWQSGCEAPPPTMQPCWHGEMKPQRSHRPLQGLGLGRRD